MKVLFYNYYLFSKRGKYRYPYETNAIAMLSFTMCFYAWTLADYVLARFGYTFPSTLMLMSIAIVIFAGNFIYFNKRSKAIIAAKPTFWGNALLSKILASLFPLVGIILSGIRWGS